jgi:phosphatidylserine/phosphatidylglycerophosphate/cardiolipin synthase-like enzyme
VRGVSRFPQLLHAKIVIVDDVTAFLVGSPFANGYWDDARHAPADVRRPMRELGGRPVHDVSTCIGGPAVRLLGGSFVELWNHADDVAPGDDQPLRPPTPHRPVADDDRSAIRIVRTAPRHSTPRHRDGRMEILPALLDGIAGARSLIYLEHQYLSARPVIDALGAALRREPALEVIVVLNQNPDVTAYRGWQNVRLRDAGLLGHPRVGLFTLWTAAFDACKGRRMINQVFVHSKVVAIDDRWAMVGSANLDGVSLHSYGDDFTGALGRRVFRGVRNFDVNAVIAVEPGDESLEAAVRDLRARLWQEHLGELVSSAALRPRGGWLPVWRALAQRNVKALGCHPPSGSLERSFVLPYSSRSAPRAQLASLGVRLALGAIELCFEPSWLEVHFSPSWVRNMFG